MIATMPMRLAIAAVAALLLPFSLAACSAAAPDPEPSDSREGNMPADVWTIAHRGASAYAPENTIPAFTLGADQWATFVGPQRRVASPAFDTIALRFQSPPHFVGDTRAKLQT